MSDRVLELVGDGLDRVPDVAKFLGVSRSQVYRLMDSGALPFVKIRSSRRVPRRAVRELAARGLVLAV
jgi:excisionase family DNA binding protein